MIHDNLINTKEDILSQLGVIKQQILIGEINCVLSPATSQLLSSGDSVGRPADDVPRRNLRTPNTDVFLGNIPGLEEGPVEF